MTRNWEDEVGRFGRHLFIIEKHSICMFPNKFCIWAIVVLISLPAVQQGKKIGESELLQS